MKDIAHILRLASFTSSSPYFSTNQCVLCETFADTKSTIYTTL